MPEYLDALEAENEGCTTSLYVDDDGTFLRAFVAPQTGRAIFAGALPFLGLDGSYMRNSYTGVALFAVTRDLDNTILVYAWAVVESESVESWHWFLANTKRAVPFLFDPYARITVVSDRNGGLQNAIDAYMPSSHKAWCCWHLTKNIREDHGGATAAKKFWGMVYAGSEDAFQKARKDVGEAGGQRALDFVDSINVRHYQRMHFRGRRFGHVTSGISESFNGKTLHHRYESVLMFLDAMWNDVMEHRYKQHDKADAAFQEECMRRASPAVKITPYARKTILESMALSKGNTAKVNTMDPTQAVTIVMSKTNKIYIVNIPEQMCSCRRYQDMLLPCGHAVTALHKLGINPMASAYSTWRNGNWQRSYTQSVLWGENAVDQFSNESDEEARVPLMAPIDIDALEADPTIKAPAFKKKPGKAQTNRLTSGQRRTEQNKPVYHCDRCGEPGHNKKTCKKVFE